jgi:putative membrane protein
VKKKIFVICVDRDNDLGRKTKITGPVIGREKNLEAAQKLALADPSESDTNTMYAAIAKLDEATKEYKNVEVVTITGEGKIGLAADKEINKQLDKLAKNYLIEGWILVTDGAEDAQVIPLLQSRAKIISTSEVIIKQAPAVESTLYTIKEALQDPGVARLVLGIPGLILIIYVVYDFLHLNNLLGMTSYQLIALVAGIYLLAKGVGLEDKIVEYFRTISKSLSEQRISFVMYVSSILVILVAIWIAYTQFISTDLIDPIVSIASTLRPTYPLITLAIILTIAARATDSIYAKKAYQIGNYLIQAISIICVWAIIDAATMVLLRQAYPSWFTATLAMSFVILIIALRLGRVFDVRERATKLFVGLNVLDEEGNYLGKVTETNKTRNTIIIQGQKNKRIEKKREQFTLSQGRIVILS